VVCGEEEVKIRCCDSQQFQTSLESWSGAIRNTSSSSRTPPGFILPEIFFYSKDNPYI